MKRLILLAWFAFVVAAGAGTAAAQSEPTVTKEEASRLEEAAALSKNSVKDAIESLKSAATESASAAVDYTLGMFYLQTSEFDKARECFEKALRKAPGFSRARAGMVRVLIEEGKTDEAVKMLQATLFNPSADVSVLTLLGYSLLLRDQPVAAETAYRQALLLEPEDSNAMAGLARCLLAQGRSAESVSLLENLLEKKPDAVQLWELLAQAELGLGHEPEALRALECGRRMGKLSSDAMATLGDLYLSAGLSAEAAAVYEEAFVGGEPPVERLLRAAEGFAQSGDHTAARALVDRAVAVKLGGKVTFSPEQQLKLDWLKAKTTELMGDRKAASQLYEAILSNHPLHGPSLMALGVWNYKLGQTQEALLYFERAARVGETEVPALLKQAQIYVDLGIYDRAVKLIENAQALKPNTHVERYLAQLKRLNEAAQRQQYD